MRPIALVPVALLFAGTAAFAAGTATHSSSHPTTPARASSTAQPSPDGGNSAAAHNCPKGPHGVHGKCVSAAAHARNAARGHGDASESPDADETAPAHPTPSPHGTPSAHPTATASPTASASATP